MVMDPPKLGRGDVCPDQCHTPRRIECQIVGQQECHNNCQFKYNARRTVGIDARMAGEMSEQMTGRIFWKNVRIDAR